MLGGMLALPAMARDGEPERVALTGGRIVPVVGAEIARGDILIEHGKITAVGEKLEIPYDARVLDVSGKTVFPGLVVAQTPRGLDVPNEMRPVTPFLDVYDAIDPSQMAFEEMLRSGVTTAHVIVGANCVIGGVGRIVRPVGLSVDEMTVAAGPALRISITPKGGYDRLLQMATLRETFAELNDYLERLAEKRYEEDLEQKKKKLDVGPAEARQRGRELVRADDIDDQHRNLVRLRGEVGAAYRPPIGRLGAFVYCGQAMDVGPAVKLAKEYGFFDRMVISAGGETFKALAELKSAARPVVLPPELIYRDVDPITGKVTETFLPSRYAESGLLWALLPGEDASLPERFMTYQAARCVRNGVARDEALRAITLNPAKILGLDARLGSIEAGKDGNLIVLSGDPLDFNTQVEQVLIEGMLVYERWNDPRMKRLTESAPAGQGERP
ncbi:MAG: Adenine deaminase [Phycisphaerae bacterium]|nr:Adenine deaminase [Phycisphaerae bacterium]